MSLLVTDNLQPWCGWFTREAVSSCEVVFGHHFETVQNVLLGYQSAFDLSITGRTTFDGEAIGFGLAPELFVVHRLQPFLNVVDVAKFFHAKSFAKSVRPTQIDTNCFGGSAA